MNSILQSQQRPIAPKTSVLMTVEDCAVDLGIQPVEVLRLIALGLLKGARVGDADNAVWRITAAALEAYVAAGCQNARCPEFQPFTDQSWYDGSRISGLAGSFYSEMLGAIEAQMPDKLTVQADYDAGKPLRYMAQTAGAIQALLEKPVPNQFLGGRGTGTDKNSRFMYFWQPYCVGLIRDAAMQILNTMAGSLSPDPLCDLFNGGPEEFATIANAAYSQAAARFISTSEPNAAQIADSNGMPVRLGVNLRWPISEILTPGRKAWMIGQTF